MIKIDTKEIFNILPDNIRMVIEGVNKLDGLQEIRIRTDKPLIVEVENSEIITSYIPTKGDLKTIVQRMSNYSIYAFEEEIRQGYITIKGGHRIGICGKCIVENGVLKTVKNIASLNIRICRQVLGCSKDFMPFIVRGQKAINTILISPPKCGKTTLLRDIAKNLSNGIKSLRFKGKKVCIVDERSEIASCFEGIPQLNVGVRTDVLDSCPKSKGVIMAIRSMAPEVIVCDEIGTNDDMKSMITALNSGVSLITTIHGYDIEDLFDRPVLRKMMDNKIFERAIVLSSAEGAGTVEYIYDLKRKAYVWRRLKC